MALAKRGQSSSPIVENRRGDAIGASWSAFYAKDEERLGTSEKRRREGRRTSRKTMV
jgi:hypothetical protein